MIIETKLVFHAQRFYFHDSENKISASEKLNEIPKVSHPSTQNQKYKICILKEMESIIIYYLYEYTTFITLYLN